MAKIKIGCGSITWGSEQPRRNVDPLAEIAQAGFQGAPCGPHEGMTAADTVAKYAEHGLEPAPGYLGADFWDPGKRDQILKDARRLAGFMAGVGCTELYVASSGFDSVARSGRTRKQAAAQVRPDDALTEDEYKQFADTLNEAGRIILAEGVKACFHNHVGSFIETREEIDHLFSMVDPKLVYQGPDIGHLAWAGVDPVEFCKNYAEQIVSMHIKDIDADVMQIGIANGWAYDQFSVAGIFAELGRGMVDLAGIMQVLESVDYDGWIIVETDRTMMPTAYDSAVISREYLRSLGY